VSFVRSAKLTSTLVCGENLEMVVGFVCRPDFVECCFGELDSGPPHSAMPPGWTEGG
jgi:hypothetical protein